MSQLPVFQIGLISDTHRPQRLAAIPQSVATAFAGVDLILHAGDVGELWVLNELSHIAPVIAVHGNDDTSDSQRELPARQILTVAGLRMLLWHSHYSDRTEEMASRRGDNMFNKLARSVGVARRAGASLVIFGHWHIPLVYQQEKVTVINPGALASGGFITRQAIKTVARLEIMANGRFQIQHINLSQPDQPYELPTRLEEGFKANAQRFEESIVSPEVAKLWPRLWRDIFPNAREPLTTLWLNLAHRCWADPGLTITPNMLLEELSQDPTVPNNVKTAVYNLFQAP